MKSIVDIQDTFFRRSLVAVYVLLFLLLSPVMVVLAGAHSTHEIFMMISKAAKKGWRGKA